MLKIKLLKICIAILFILLISGCGGSGSEFESCYGYCRSKEYYKVDSSCDNTATSLVQKYCNITNDTIIEIKDNCFTECNINER